MNTKIISVLFGFIALVTTSFTNAATIQLIPSSLSVSLGESFDLTLEANFDVATLGGGLSVTWDSSILTLNTNDATILADLNTAGFPDSTIPVSTAGQVDMLITFFDLGGTGVSGNKTLTTLNFTATNLTDPTTQVALGFIAQQPWYAADGLTLLDPQPSLSGATITVSAVPVPPAVWLFGSGLVGLVAVSRRRRMTLPV